MKKGFATLSGALLLAASLALPAYADTPYGSGTTGTTPGGVGSGVTNGYGSTDVRANGTSSGKGYKDAIPGGVSTQAAGTAAGTGAGDPAGLTNRRPGTTGVYGKTPSGMPSSGLPGSSPTDTTGTTSGIGSTGTGSNPDGTRGNYMPGTSFTGTLGSGTDGSNTLRANAADTSEKSWGWLGFVGLLGLIGLAGRREKGES
jgi:hypothetical protein